MNPPDELLASRSREGYRKFAWQLAVACMLVSACYFRMATVGHPVPLIISLACAGILALIGQALPDRRPPSDEMRDYEDGRRGTVGDGR